VKKPYEKGNLTTSRPLKRVEGMVKCQIDGINWGFRQSVSEKGGRRSRHARPRKVAAIKICHSTRAGAGPAAQWWERGGKHIPTKEEPKWALC